MTFDNYNFIQNKKLSNTEMYKNFSLFTNTAFCSVGQIMVFCKRCEMVWYSCPFGHIRYPVFVRKFICRNNIHGYILHRHKDICRHCSHCKHKDIYVRIRIRIRRCMDGIRHIRTRPLDQPQPRLLLLS